ncbi:MAG: methionyl-tRNA formyltransferase [Verrucomicrobiota bacterium]|nr:methionyl-tRNA formyltransferase [Verrucomicrobiota bacterium]
MKLPTIVFFGTPLFAGDILEFLIDNKISIAAIVTQPDRPKGRSLQLTPSFVKQVAQTRLPNVPILQPQKASEPEFLTQLQALSADLYVVVAFGQILPQKLLDIPSMGCVNVHASLLPKYRGAAPIQRCLMNGETETGVCVQKMVKQLDAGDVIAETKISIPPEMTAGELEKVLCDESKPLLLSVLKAFGEGTVTATPQDPAQVTYAAKIEPEEGEIDWTKSAEELHNLIRAFNPRPGAWCSVAGKRFKIFRATVEKQQGTPRAFLSPKELIVGCGKDALKLLQVQPEGKPRMLAADWLRGLSSSPLFE